MVLPLPSQVLRCLDIFAGAGGLSFLHQRSKNGKVDIRGGWAVDINTSAAATYQANHPDAAVGDTGVCWEGGCVGAYTSTWTDAGVTARLMEATTTPCSVDPLEYPPAPPSATLPLEVPTCSTLCHLLPPPAGICHRPGRVPVAAAPVERPGGVLPRPGLAARSAAVRCPAGPWTRCCQT